MSKLHRGVAKVNRKLEKNGNPMAQFDVNKRKEFRFIIMVRSESGTTTPSAKKYDIENQDKAVLKIIGENLASKKISST